jgi:hypothetical protein
MRDVFKNSSQHHYMVNRCRTKGRVDSTQITEKPHQENLAAENRILRAQFKGRLLLPDAEKATLAEIAQRLGRKGLEELAAVAKPDTLLAWYRKLIANKFDGSRFRQRVGRPRIDEEAEQLVLQMAKENPSWGYDRIVGP